MDGKYSVDTISKYIINYCDEHFGGVSNLRLQKLLYFVQAQFIMDLDIAAFKEEMEAWSFGPVVPEIYRKYKIFGRDNIILNTNDDIKKYLFSFDDAINEEISNEDMHIIDKALKATADVSTAELVRVSHIQDPWKNAYKGENFFGQIISKESIKKYFVG